MSARVTKSLVLFVLLLIFAYLSLVAEAKEAVPIDPPPPPVVLPDDFVYYAEVGCDGTDPFCVPGTQNRTKQISIATGFSGAYTGTFTVLSGSTADQGFDYALLNGGQCTSSNGTACVFDIEVFAEPLPAERPHETFEILAKDAAYRDWSVGDDIEGELHRDGYALSRLGYRVDRTFHPGFGFQAFGLSANEVIELQIDFHSPGGAYFGTLTGKVILYDHDRPPILIVRGTEPKTINDWFANLDSTTIGLPQYQAAKVDIEKWLSDLSDPEGNGKVVFRPHLTGHSLGGALSQLIAAYYTKAGGRLGQIVTFNSPGIARADVARFQPDRAVSVTHHTMRGDIVTLAGEAYLPRGASQDGSAFQTQPVWVEYGYPGYSGIRDTILGIMLDKHLLPMITAFIHNPNQIRLQPPGIQGYPQPDSIAFLESPLYNYWSDPANPRVGDRDYLVFMAQVADLQQDVIDSAGDRFTGPNLVRALSFRGTAEEARKAIGSRLFRDQVVAPTVRMWDESSRWRTIIWATIRTMSTGIPILPKSANTGLSATGNASVPFATHFWEAVAQWPVAAWDASPEWGDHAWQAMTKWNERQWATTVQPGFDWNTTRNRDANWWKDFAELPGKTIRGFVYNDEDGNGKKENEPGLRGRLVFLDENNDGVDNDQFRAQSGITGAYTLTVFGLPNNADYRIRQVLPDPQNWSVTEPPLAEDYTHVVHFNDDDDQIIESVNFGNHCFGDCSDDIGTTETTIVINDHAFLSTFTNVPRAGPVDTGISVSQWVCGVVGFESQGGRIYDQGTSEPLWRTRLVAHGTWHITASFRTKDFNETWPRVDVLCFSTKVASLGAPEPGKPVFRQTFGSEEDPLGGDREHDLKIYPLEYVCGLVGAFSPGLSDINEDGAGRIVQLNLYPKRSEYQTFETWRAKPDFRSHDTLFGFGGHESWVIDALCISNAVADNGGQRNKGFSVYKYTFSDSIVFNTGLSSDHYACGVIGFVAKNGDIFEGNADPNDTLVKVYAVPEGGSWRIHADFRTHKGRNETWDVDLLCGARGTHAAPKLFTAVVPGEEPKRYGPGIALNWSPTIDPQATHYEIQVSEEGSPWQTYTASRKISHGGWINFHGNLECGVDFVRCIKSDTRYSFRVRVLDRNRPGSNDDKAIGDWSYVLSVRSIDWADLPRLENKPPTISGAPNFISASPGDTVTFSVTANDSDPSAILEILVNGLPFEASFLPPFGTGTVTAIFIWHVTSRDSSQVVTFTAEDQYGARSRSLTTFISVCEDESECDL